MSLAVATVMLLDDAVCWTKGTKFLWYAAAPRNIGVSSDASDVTKRTAMTERMQVILGYFVSSDDGCHFDCCYRVS